MPEDEEEEGKCFKMRLVEYHNYKTLMGPCLISFSIPLLVPGVVLTVVGSYGNELTFPTFGGWHITGIVFLSFSIILLIVGIFMKCFFKPVISADIEEHLTPASSVISGKKNLAYIKDNEATMGSGRRGNRRVSHLDSQGAIAHTVASTHESKTPSSQSTRSRDVPNGAVGAVHQSSKHSKEKSDKETTIHSKAKCDTETKVAAGKSTNNANIDVGRSVIAADDDTDDVKRRVDPPSYETTVHKQTGHKKRRSSNSLSGPDGATHDNTKTTVTETKSGNVTTHVTASITAEAETAIQSSSRGRDPSSDTTEHSQFLPEKKRKKKKKRRHRQSTEMCSLESDNTMSDSTRSELPDLRIKSVLVHDGSHSHHQHCHVHFDPEPGVNSPTAEGECQRSEHGVANEYDA